MDELTLNWLQAIDYDDYHEERFGVKTADDGASRTRSTKPKRKETKRDDENLR